MVLLSVIRPLQLRDGETLASRLMREWSRGRKQRHNLKRLCADLVELGYTGSYDRVAAFTRSWRMQQHEVARVAGHSTFVTLLFAPGEAFQFNWSKDWAATGG